MYVVVFHFTNHLAECIPVDSTVAEAEQLFKTEYYAYEHTDSGKMSIACDEYHLPSHLTSHIDFIKPGIKLMHGKATRSNLDKRGFRTSAKSGFSGPLVNPVTPQIVNSTTAEMLSLCDQYITPPCIATMYNISQATKAHSGNQLGIFEEGDFYAPEDLALYFATFAQGSHFSLSQSCIASMADLRLAYMLVASLILTLLSAIPSSTRSRAFSFRPMITTMLAVSKVVVAF